MNTDIIDLEINISIGQLKCLPHIWDEVIVMKIRINYQYDNIIHSVTIETNGDLKEIAKQYFTDPNVKSIDILDGGQDYENENFSRTLIKLYRVSPEEQKKFVLFYNIRVAYKIEYKPEYRGKRKDIEGSCGFLRIT